MSSLIATRPIILAKLRKASDANHRSGVLALQAQPTWSEGDFRYDGTDVAVVGCPSPLAIWEAIGGRKPDQWLVILTNVSNEDLGIGIQAHLVDGRVLAAQPWDAVRGNFSATTLEPALYQSSSNDRGLAEGLLAVLPPDACLPAPGGVLTRDHALAAVARNSLKVTDQPDTEIDPLAVLEWSLRPDAAADFATLQNQGGPELTVAVRSWLAERSGRLEPIVTSLLKTGKIAELVPLGLVASVIVPGSPAGLMALGELKGRYGLTSLSHEDLRDWSRDAAGLVTGPKDTMPDQVRQSVLDIAERRAHELGLDDPARASDLLPQGIAHRIDALAQAITAALPNDEVTTLAGMESAWQSVQHHALAESHPECQALEAAVRLVRWLGSVDPTPADLAEYTQRHVDIDAWVDAALSTARRGATSPGLVDALGLAIKQVTARRAQRDVAFAAALADAEQPNVPVVENLMHQVVLPLAKNRPTLLLVIDGLSMAAATDIVRDAQARGWSEAAPLQRHSRVGALAVLPTLTLRSRCSLLSGELREGTERDERQGFTALLRAHGLQPEAGKPDPIFHKGALDTKTTGAKLAAEVRNAIADTEGCPLVAAVLNYVDDMLHHVGPGGTTWNIATITHLEPLLAEARAAGRAVVITSDHGHIIEHRNSHKRNRINAVGQRAHLDLDTVEAGEVLVRGPRVLTEPRSVVLAVDETIRYDRLNAGYHGGGSPAEVVVPVVVLYTRDCPAGLTKLGATEPPWWYGSAQVVEPPVRVEKPTKPHKLPVDEIPALFEKEVIETAPEATPATASRLPDRVVGTAVFAEQRKLAGRLVVDNEQFVDLLTALMASPAHEITLAQAANVLKVGKARVAGPLYQIKRVLDVEGYEVLLMGPGSVRLDEALLREQFGIAE
ncbi:BREX-2 system phosphatase PglZ [Nocardia wallacei]|uniref:BREX-2 system phosphatase PglZ n=1 Tax=Nocardia wallacei TaxID=480035 RepID=UPI002454C449|nr:BREX-2 system phosphatase PglZ [Nocardia wallacei]